jgi:hypothetical protein
MQKNEHLMKYLLIGFLTLLTYIDSMGNTYGIVTGSIENVYYGGIVAGETQYQNQAIAFLCNEHIKRYYPTIKEKVFLELGFGEHCSYKISYDKYQGEQWNNAENNRPAKGFGIRIRLSQKLNRAESVLKILEYGLNNLSELKDSSKKYFKMDDNDRPDDLTVDSTVLSKIILSPNNDRITSTLETKVYRNLGNVDYKISKEYFFQNDKFHFADYWNKDSVYLELKQVYQIISEYYLGTLIFETDSTGFFYSRESKQLSSKFQIIDKKAAFYFMHTSSDNDKKRIYFEYDLYKEGKKKFIYLTDKLILIQKVDEYEDEMINAEIKKCTKG